MSKRQKLLEDLGECAYCGARATTKDHIPPKGTYSKSWRDKPWVPACVPCNRGASLDDEYMQRLSMLWGADACQDAVEVGEKFMRSLERPEAGGLQADVQASLSPVQDATRFPGGLSMALKGNRLERITDKLVRGWWFKLTGSRLPEGHEIMKYNLGKKHENELYASNEKLILTCPGLYLGDRAFGFSFAYCPETLITCWLFEFYRVFRIMAYTCEMHEETFRILDLRTTHGVINHDRDGVKLMVAGQPIKI